jgi:hypothetical protein
VAANHDLDGGSGDGGGGTRTQDKINDHISLISANSWEEVQSIA